MKNSGAKWEPWGTPDKIWNEEDEKCLYFTICFWSESINESIKKYLSKDINNQKIHFIHK